MTSAYLPREVNRFLPVQLASCLQFSTTKNNILISAPGRGAVITSLISPPMGRAAAQIPRRLRRCWLIRSAAGHVDPPWPSPGAEPGGSSSVERGVDRGPPEVLGPGRRKQPGAADWGAPSCALCAPCPQLLPRCIRRFGPPWCLLWPLSPGPCSRAASSAGTGGDSWGRGGGGHRGQSSQNWAKTGGRDLHLQVRLFPGRSVHLLRKKSDWFQGSVMQIAFP